MEEIILKGATCLLPDGPRLADIHFRNGKIIEIGALTGKKAPELQLKNLHVLPGVIDTQVHFREPGLEHKEDLESGSRAAALGGVTGFFEMPNTKPSTTTQVALEDKIKRAHGRVWTDYGFYVGATSENVADLPKLERMPGVCGIKIFMGSSTGTLLLADSTLLEEVFRTTKRRMALHAEDESRLNERKALVPEGSPPEMHPFWRDEQTALLAVKKAVALAEKYKHPIHILHVSSRQEMEFLRQHKSFVSVETLPQFLTFSGPEIYRKIGTLAQMNPPIRNAEHLEPLWQAVRNGTVDVLGTDHAPHTLEEKSKPYPTSPSGMPGVQTLVPVMLDHVAKGRLSLELFSNLVSRNPARLFGLKDKGEIRVGADADFTIVDLKKTWTVSKQEMASKCGWTPYEGMTLTGKAIGTVIRGATVMWEGQLQGQPQGRAFEYL